MYPMAKAGGAVLCAAVCVWGSKCCQKGTAEPSPASLTVGGSARTQPQHTKAGGLEDKRI